MPDNRVHHLRKHTYNTRSNKIRKIRTPGGRLTIQYIKKVSKGPQTAIKTRARLSGLKKMSNASYSRQTRSSRRIARPYGGVITPEELKEKIMRAFLIEEVKIVKKIVKSDKQEKHAKVGAEKKQAEAKKPVEAKKVAAKPQAKTQKPKGK